MRKALVLKEWNGPYVFGVDITDKKVALAKRYGADEVINVRDRDMAQRVMRLTSCRGVDAVADMVSTKQTLEEGIKSLGTGGVFVVVGVPQNIKSLDFNPLRLLREELILTGCRCATRQEISESLELVRRGVVKPVVPNRFSIKDANQVQKLIDNMELCGRTAFVFD